jgi:DNA-directed RNA polymerase subunit N (RpoN/RPB10)
LGDLAKAYKYIRYKKIRQTLENIDRNCSPDMFTMMEELQISMEEELDQLGLTCSCCRTTMLTSVEFPLWSNPE